MRYSVRWRSQRGGHGNVPFNTPQAAAIYHAEKVVDLARLAGPYMVETVDSNAIAPLTRSLRE